MKAISLPQPHAWATTMCAVGSITTSFGWRRQPRLGPVLIHASANELPGHVDGLMKLANKTEGQS
ncbi:hypothetical protein [Stappia indica]|uniref:hypothetical protein n=1 Tax=Stappia indica TaxID=538381 RepID=UPI001CD764E3|nr:hypothetical protein [Stappia indica]MCA1298006.1 hypothetical protein [Stappia indica]